MPPSTPNPTDGPVAHLRLAIRNDKLRLSATLHKPDSNDMLARTVTLPKDGVGAQPQEIVAALRHFEQLILDHLVAQTSPPQAPAQGNATAGAAQATP